MSLKKSELEELNQTLCQVIREKTDEVLKLQAEILRLQGENARLQEALDRASAALLKLRKQFQLARQRYQKLTDYVKRLHAWASTKRKEPRRT